MNLHSSENMMPRGGMRARVALTLLAALVGFVVASCDIPEFDPPNILKTRRILAVKTDPREAAPGDTVTITGLAVESDGKPYAGTVAWFLTTSAAGTVEAPDSPEDLPEGDYYIQLPGAPPFEVTLPDRDAFAEKFGDYDADGTVLTVAMAIGDLEKDPVIAVKSFVVRDEPAKENPVFNKIDVIVNGETTEPDGAGVVPVGNVGQIKLVADVDFPTGDLKTFHWYTATEGVEFNVEKATSWRLPKKTGIYDLYCVARESTRTTIGQGVYRVQSSGIDWAHVAVEISSGTP